VVYTYKFNLAHKGNLTKIHILYVKDQVIQDKIFSQSSEKKKKKLTNTLRIKTTYQNTSFIFLYFSLFHNSL